MDFVNCLCSLVVEHRTCNAKAPGSNPGGGSFFFEICVFFFSQPNLFFIFYFFSPPPLPFAITKCLHLKDLLSSKCTKEREKTMATRSQKYFYTLMEHAFEQASHDFFKQFELSFFTSSIDLSTNSLI